MNETLIEQSIADTMRSSSTVEHRAAESRPFIVDLMGGGLSLADYVRYLAQLAWVYEALESRTPSTNDPGSFDSRFARLAHIESDLAALGVGDWRTEYPALRETVAYLSHLRSIPSDDIARWTAHHYTRYLGDLSGEQAIARLVARNYGATAEQLTYFDFSALGDVVPIKRAYREGLDSLDLTDEQLDTLLDEVRLAYEFNSAIFDGLGR